MPRTGRAGPEGALLCFRLAQQGRVTLCRHRRLGSRRGEAPALRHPSLRGDKPPDDQLGLGSQFGRFRSVASKACCLGLWWHIKVAVNGGAELLSSRPRSQRKKAEEQGPSDPKATHLAHLSKAHHLPIAPSLGPSL